MAGESRSATRVPDPHAQLHVSIDTDLRFRYRLEVDRQTVHGTGPRLSHLCGEGSPQGQGWTDLQAACSRLRELARRSGVVPLSIDQPIRSWAARSSDPILLIASDDDRIAGIPWELLPIGQRWPNALVARSSNGADALPRPLPFDPVLLVAVWRHARPAQIGMERELAELPVRMKSAGLRVVTLEDPTRSALVDACRAHEPAILHLATSALLHTASGPAIDVAPGEDQDASPIAIADICADLRRVNGPQLVVLNIRHSNRAAALVARHLGVASIGWLGPIEDQTAVDFSFLLYDRLAARHSVTRAIREFAGSIPFGEAGRRNGLAIAWLPRGDDFELLPVGRHAVPIGQPVTTRSAAQADPRAAPEPLDSPPASEPAAVSLDFRPVPVIGHALLNSARSCIARLALECSAEALSVALEVTCDTGAGTSRVKRMAQLSKGMTRLREGTFAFPALHELATRRVSRRAINFTVTVTAGNTLLCEDTQSSLWLGFDEWLDREDAWCFAPAYVQPLNPAVLEIVRAASETLRMLGEPNDVFHGYRRPDFTRPQMAALFQTLRRREYALDYTVPGPLVYTASDHGPSGQRVRLPDEILRYRRATCYDLVLLVAACAEQIGLRPLIVLAPHHAVLAIWTSVAAFDDYWTAREQERASDDFGEDWMVRDPNHLKQLLDDEAIDLVECVDLTRPNRRFQDACAGWDGNPWSAFVERFQAAVDVHRARRIVPPVTSPE